MAIKEQLKNLPIGTIVNDKTTLTKYIILETKYNITSGKTSDGVLLGFYSNNNLKFFENKIFEKDTLGKLYNESDIKNLLNSVPEELKTSERLKNFIMPTMVASNNNSYDLIGPMLLFLPSLIELGEIPSNEDAIIAGVTIDISNTIVKQYILDLKKAKILMRNSYDLNVYLSNNTTVNMDTPQNLVYFLCVDPSLYVGIDEDKNYYLFDNFTNSKNELNSAVDYAEKLIKEYESNLQFKDSINFLKRLIEESKSITDVEDQSIIDQLTQEILDATSLLETQIKSYESLQNRIEQNISSINELVEMINDFILLLTKNGNLSTPEIQQEINNLNLLKNELSSKIDNIKNKSEDPMNIIDLNKYLDSKYSTYYSLENDINKKIFINTSIISAITDLGKLIQESIAIIAKYPLVDKTTLQISINNANAVISSSNPTLAAVQNSILDLSAQKQNFINSITFEVDTQNPILEIGLCGRRPIMNITLKNNTGSDINAISSDNNIVMISSPLIAANIDPIGSAKQYPITGISEGIATITFSIINEDISKILTIPIIVSKKDTIDPSYLDLVEDGAKVSIQQIDGGKKDFNHLGDRLEMIEEKLFGSSSTLDPNLLNILNTTTPTPITNNIEMIIIKDADITNGKSTVINLKNNYYIGKQHLTVYRNGVYQQLGIRYTEKTNNSVEFTKDYLLPGDRMLFISGHTGMYDLSQVLVEYTEGGLITKIKFLKDGNIFREIEYIYDDKPQIVKQIIYDQLYEFVKIFKYNDNNLVSDIEISIKNVGE